MLRHLIFLFISVRGFPNIFKKVLLIESLVSQSLYELKLP